MRATRNPMSLLRLSRLFPLRLAARRFSGLLFRDPPPILMAFSMKLSFRNLEQQSNVKASRSSSG